MPDLVTAGLETDLGPCETNEHSIQPDACVLGSGIAQDPLSLRDLYASLPVHLEPPRYGALLWAPSIEPTLVL